MILKIKLKKCHFFQCCIVFLGYVLSADSISANPEKVDKVKSWPVPMSPKELHSFLGLVSYYHHFIPNFAVIAKGLHDLVGPTNVKRKTKKESKATKEPKKTKSSIGQVNIRRHLIFKDLLDMCASARLSRYFKTISSGNRCIAPRVGCCIVSKR